MQQDVSDRRQGKFLQSDGNLMSCIERSCELKSQKVQINKAVHLLKAVTGQGNEVSDINENEILQLDLIEDIPLNFRIACENKLTPCKLHFSYKTAGTIEVHVLCGKKEVRK